MKSLPALPLIALLALVSPVSAGTVRNGPPLPVLKAGAWDTLKLKWDKPENENNDSGIPLGNGYFGGKLKGGVGREFINLNDLTFWSKGPSDNQDPKRQPLLVELRTLLAAGDLKAADPVAKQMWGSGYVGEYTPIGKLILTFPHGDTATKYRRELDLDRALATVEYTIGGVTYTRESFASYPDRVMVMRLTSSEFRKLSFTVSMDYPKEMEGHGGSVVAEGNDVLVMTGKAPSASGWDPVKGMKAEARLGIVAKGGKVTGSGKTLRVEDADSAILYYVDATSFNGFDKEPGAEGVNPTPITKQLLAAAVAKGYDKLFAAHLADYQAIFRRLWVELNGESPNPYALGLEYARYEMIASSRTGQAPHNLQGMWNRDWSPVNAGAYYLNENLQKYYGLIEPANIADTGVPLWHFIYNLSVRGAKNAKIDWGFNGWVATHYTDIWADAVLKGGQNWWSMWPMGGAWICQNLYDHYAFSLDRTFLAQAYPVLKGQAEFVLDLLVEDGKGHLAPSPSSSPENMFRVPGSDTQLGVTVGSACDLSLTRQLFTNVIQASTVLGADLDFRGKLQAALARLAPIQIQPDGKINEWSRPDTVEVEPHHRHASSTIGVWPLAVITRHGTPDLFAAAKVTLLARGGGGYHPDKAAMWARLGEGDRAVGADDSFPTGNSLVERWNPKYASFCELLVQSQSGEIELLPALPTKWKSGKIEGVRARGGYQVSLEWQDGKLTRCRIDSPYGTVPVIRYEDKILNPANDFRVTVNLLGGMR